MVYLGGWLVDVFMARRKWMSNAFKLEMKCPCSCFSKWIELKLWTPFVHLWIFAYPPVDYVSDNHIKNMLCSKMWRRLFWSTVTAVPNGSPSFILCTDDETSVSFRNLVYCGSYTASRPGKLHYLYSPSPQPQISRHCCKHRVSDIREILYERHNTV